MAFTAEHATRFLQAAHERNRLPHALLIVDPHRLGAPVVASRLVSLLNHVPEKELDAMEDEYCRIVRARSKSRRILVDEIRDIEPFFQKRALPGKWKIGIFPEVDCLNEQSANAFLKTLEEPPPQSLILLITAFPERLMQTIRSRCVRVDIFTPGTGYEPTDTEKKILPAWINMCKNLGSELHTLAFRGEMTRVLSEVKTEISSRLELALKETSREISKSSGITDWEKQMQEATAAHIEMEYLAERDNLLDFFMAWLGDALLLASKAPQLRFPQYKEALEELLLRESLPSLIRRIEALERLRDDLKTNVHEALALDVRLLEALA